VAERDYAAMARTLTLEEFVECQPFLFLWGLGRLAQGNEKFQTQIQLEPGDRKNNPLQALVRAVRKASDADPGLITVGRTANNDIVIDDTTVSKRHAWFRERAGSLELADAGSRNGTWVSTLRLAPGGSPVGTPLGSVVRFGDFSFRLLDAKEIWLALHS
jgi:pSer/pThr/pTyr-binding forkhead associated (FHA) protein